MKEDLKKYLKAAFDTDHIEEKNKLINKALLRLDGYNAPTSKKEYVETTTITVCGIPLISWRFRK